MAGILIVEDDPDTLEILNVVLTRRFSGIPVFMAANGRRGVELFDAEPADVVITDVNMPEMNGVEMVREMRARRPETRFVFITADAGRATLEHSVGDGFQLVHYLAKPISYQELFSAVEQSLASL